MLVFTIPLCLILINLSWPVFERAWVSGEMSQNAGGLIRWPVFLLVPVGFGLLALQCLSELIKRVAFLTGDRPEPFSEIAEKSDEQLLLEELEAKANAARQEAR
jgi:TRAP-type mannitol/chloroaromatic compound transport system permease small subunit